MIKNLISKFKIYGLPRFLQYAFLEIRRKIWFEFVLNSYSQNGEDLVIHKLLGNKKRGFYVDVGANDPVRFSNTQHFYRIGWRGINIEPNFNCFIKIKNARKRDLNLNFGIGGKRSKIMFYQFNFHTLSTFSKKEALLYQKQGYKLDKTKKIKVEKLSYVFKTLLKNRKIDFMSVDTEGFDKVVLLSNDWKKYRPRVLCIESVNHTIGGTKKSSGINKVLKDVGYKLYSDNGLNSIYVDLK